MRDDVDDNDGEGGRVPGLGGTWESVQSPIKPFFALFANPLSRSMLEWNLWKLSAKAKQLEALLCLQWKAPNLKIRESSIFLPESWTKLPFDPKWVFTTNIYRNQQIALEWWCLVPNTKTIAPNSWSEMYESKHVHFPNPICEIFTRSPAASLKALTHLRAR